MVKYFSKFTKMLVQDTTKEKPFAVLLNDERGFYIKDFKKQIKKYPKLKELNIRGIKSIKLSQAEEEDIIVFGDTIAPLTHDFRVVGWEDIRSTRGINIYEIATDYAKILKALKSYHKANYPKEHRLLQQPTRSRKKSLKSPPKYAYYSRVSGKRIKPEINLELEIPRALLKRYPEIEIEIELPKSSKSNRFFEETIIGRKKKVGGKQYVIHQNFVKAGLKVYNIYENRNGDEYTNINGKKYLIFRRRNKKDFLVEE